MVLRSCFQGKFHVLLFLIIFLLFLAGLYFFLLTDRRLRTSVSGIDMSVDTHHRRSLYAFLGAGRKAGQSDRQFGFLAGGPFLLPL